MSLIAQILIIVAAIVLYRLYRVKRAICKAGGFENLKINLPVRFFAEQAIGLFCVCLLLYALEPVEAFYSICAVVGTFIDTVFTMLYYSAKYSTDIETKVRTGAI